MVREGGTIRFRLFWWGGCFTTFFLQVSGVFVMFLGGMEGGGRGLGYC